MDRNANAVGVVHDGTTVSVTESLTQIEIEIVNKIGIVHTTMILMVNKKLIID